MAVILQSIAATYVVGAVLFAFLAGWEWFADTLDDDAEVNRLPKWWRLALNVMIVFAWPLALLLWCWNRGKER